MSMSRSEAAQLLEIPENADAKTVNAAYRKCIAKYHPDANRNKSPQEQQYATEMFKKCGVAKKVMLAPPEAPKPTPSPTPTPTTNRAAYNSQQAQYQAPRANTAQQQARQPQPQQSGSNNTFYNKASTFVDNIPKVVDDAERQIHNFYQKETKKKYNTPVDLFRLTPSAFVTLGYIIVAILAMLLAPPIETVVATGDMFALMPFTISPLLVFIGVMILKFAIYDGIISFYTNKLFKKLKLNWWVQCGIEAILTAAIYIAVAASMSLSLDIMLVGAGMLGGIICLAIGIVRKIGTTKKKSG